jgi:serine/threonine protein kinase/streptogramin lyase
VSVGAELSVGSELLGYRIEVVLGRGGMGIVYLAEDLRLKRRVALKLLSPELAEDERFRERLLAESELAASLDHPNIVPIYQAGEADGRIFISMRYVEGDDLKRVLRKGPLSPEYALALVSQVASALDEAHARGLVHRDVKPSNVLLAPAAGHEGADHVYLADFGLTQRLVQQELSPDQVPLMGTIDYVAPEQIRGEAVDGRADVYSLGCLLFECLAGEPPFRHKSEIALLFAHLRKEPPSLIARRPDLPPQVDSVIATALAKEPEARYPTCRALVEAAREALSGRDETHRPARPRLRRRLAASGLLAAAAALAAGLSLALLGGTPGGRAKPTTLLSADSLQRIDPTTKTLVATIPVGVHPVGVAVGLGAVWVINKDDSTLMQINPNTNRVVREVSLKGFAPDLIAVGEGAVWMAQESTGIPGEWLWKYDPRTGSAAAVHTGDIIPNGLNVGAGAVWIVDYLRVPDGLLRLRPTAPSRPLAVGGCPCSAPAFAGGAGWALAWPHYAAAPTAVYRLEPETRKVVAKIALGFEAGWLAAGEGAIWITNPRAESVTRVDPATNRATRTFPTGRIPAVITAGAGAVWVANSRDGTVTRYDPASADIETIRVGGTPGAVAVGAGGVWVTTEAR